MRWSQLGFGRTSSTSTAQDTPRNLFGFKDGTANVKAEEPEGLAQHVWVAPEDERGGGEQDEGGSDATHGGASHERAAAGAATGTVVDGRRAGRRNSDITTTT